MKQIPSRQKASSSVLGRSRFEKISLVEGIQTSHASRQMFADFERQGLTAEQRREAIVARYKKKA